MGFVHVQGQAVGATPGTTSISLAGSVISSGSTVVVLVSADNGSLPTATCTDDKGNTYTLLDSFVDTSNNQKSFSFILGNINNGPSTITANFSGICTARAIAWDEYSGVLAVANPSDSHTVNFQSTPGTGTNAVVSGNITTTNDGDLIWGALSCDSGGDSPVAGTGFNSRSLLTGAAGSLEDLLTEDQVQATHGSVQTTFTIGIATATLCFIVAIKPAISITTIGKTVSPLFSPRRPGRLKLQPTRAFPLPPSGNITVNITGVQSNTAAGTLFVTVQPGFGGAGGTTGGGTFVPGVTDALGSVQSNTAVGSTIEQITGAAVTVIGTSGSGTLIGGSAVTISVQSNTAAGTLFETITITLSGVQSNSNIGTLIEQITGAAVTVVGTSGSGTLIGGDTISISAADTTATGNLTIAELISTLGATGLTTGGSLTFNFFVGVQANTAAGTLFETIGPTISGASDTTAVGSTIKQITGAAVTVVGTSGAGTLFGGANVSITVSSTTSAGALLEAISGFLVSGATGTTSVGTLIEAIIKVITGVSDTTSAGTLFDTIGPTITGGSDTTGAGTFAIVETLTIPGATGLTTGGSLVFNPPFFTGVQSNTTAGSFTIGEVINLLAAVDTSSAGTLVTNVGPTISGGSGTSSAGSLTPTEIKNLIAAASTSNAGILLEGILPTISGVLGTSGAGLFLDAATVQTLNGVLTTSAPGLLTGQADSVLISVPVVSSIGVAKGQVGIDVHVVAQVGQLTVTVSGFIKLLGLPPFKSKVVYDGTQTLFNDPILAHANVVHTGSETLLRSIGKQNLMPILFIPFVDLIETSISLKMNGAQAQINSGNVTANVFFDGSQSIITLGNPAELFMPYIQIPLTLNINAQAILTKVKLISFSSNTVTQKQ